MDDLLSTAEAAKMLGISRVALFNKIKSGKISAKKVGRNYIIPRKEIENISQGKLSARNKADLDKGVNKVVNEYEETLKLLQNN